MRYEVRLNSNNDLMQIYDVKKDMFLNILAVSSQEIYVICGYLNDAYNNGLKDCK